MDNLHSLPYLWRRKWQPTPVILPGEFHGQRSLAGYIGLQRVRHDWATITYSLLTFSTSLPVIPGITIAPKETTYI